MDCNICRVCLKMCSVVHSLHQKDTTQLLETLTNIKILKNDAYPENCCETCWKNISVVQELQKMFKKSTEKLRSLIKTHGNYDELYVSTSNSVTVKIEEDGVSNDSIKTDDEDYYENNMELDPLDFNEIVNSNEYHLDPTESLNNEFLSSVAKTEINDGKVIITVQKKFKDTSVIKNDVTSNITGIFEDVKSKNKLLESQDIVEDRNFNIIPKKEANINDILAQVTFRMNNSKKDDLSKYYERLETPDDIIKRLKPTPSKKYSYYCTICEKTYDGMSMQHKYQHIKAKCKICGLITRADNIRKHILLHQWGSQLCDICGSSHKSIEGLRSHIYSFHTRKDPYKCDECGKEFNLSSKLAYHKRRIHIGGRDYVCDECGKAFFSSETRKKHKNLVHLNLRPHICDFCQRGFSSPYALKTHRRQHTGELPFLCNLCDAGYRQAVSLRTHMKSKHKIIMAVNKPGVTYKQQKQKQDNEEELSNLEESVAE